MNRQSGRRRGRGGNNRPQNNGGGRGSDPQNRIDNRTRGNAAQLLEKYKGLARDAQMAGDRVNTEYYLQFADHYFRVLADAQARREEQQAANGERQQRWRDQNASDDFIEGVDDIDFGVESDAVDSRRTREARDDAEQQEDGAEERTDNRRDRNMRPSNRDNRRDNNRESGRDSNRQQRNAPGGGSYRAYRESQEGGANDGRVQRKNREEAVEGGFDQSILPPAISITETEDAPKPKRGRARKAVDAVEVEVVETPKPKRTTRARKPVIDAGDDIAAE